MTHIQLQRVKTILRKLIKVQHPLVITLPITHPLITQIRTYMFIVIRGGISMTYHK